jgi:hypothetical protein
LVWPADRDNPLGWRDAGKQGIRACNGSSQDLSFHQARRPVGGPRESVDSFLSAVYIFTPYTMFAAATFASNRMLDYFKRVLADIIAKGRAVDLLSSDRFVTWPPASTAEELQNLCARVSWLLPIPAEKGQILVASRIPAGIETVGLHIPTEVCADPERARSAIASGSTVLVWRMGGRSLAAAPCLKAMRAD